MRYHALACDYDGTLAVHGQVLPKTVRALERFRNSGRKLILVTGRQLEDLRKVFDRLSLFDRVVAENGGVLYNPAEHEERTLGEPPPPEFIEELKRRGISPSVGKVIVATSEPHQNEAMQAIHDLGIEYHIIFNKGAVMILPSGMNKATGLKSALTDMALSPHNVIGVGDAENDNAFLNLCEYSVAVANALPFLKRHSDYVTPGERGEGVIQLIDMMLDDTIEESPRP